MSELVRFGVFLEKPLLDRFDSLIRERQYTNRSKALRDLIRRDLVQREWREGRDVAGAITLIYDHHKRDVLAQVDGHPARVSGGDHFYPAHPSRSP